MNHYHGRWSWQKFCITAVAVIISFNQSDYSIDENDGLVQPVLVLINSVLTDNVTVQIRANDITATGE